MWLRDFIQHNFWLKLFSFILAILIWFGIKVGIQRDVDLGQSPITHLTTHDSVPLPVMVLTQPGDARVFKVTPDRVYVTVTGESAILSDLSRKEYKAYVDLTNPRAAGTSEKVRLHVPSGVTVIQVSPLAVAVEQVSP